MAATADLNRYSTNSSTGNNNLSLPQHKTEINVEDCKKVCNFKTKFPKSGDEIFLNCDIFSTPEELFLNHGYYSENHEVITEDGYILTLFRLPYGKGETKPNATSASRKRPVLFVHGIVLSGISWVLNADENVLAYQLANKGHDIWLYNARGTEFSKKHTILSPKSRKYWDFSFSEMGKFDVPAVISHIMKYTEHDQIYYVAHSMGCPILFSAISMRPELASKIKLMICYAPAAYLEKAQTPFVRVASRIPGFTSLCSLLYHGELYGESVVKAMTKFAPWIWICRNRRVRDSTWFLWKFMGIVNGKDEEQIYWPMLPVISGHLPASTSVKTYKHFLQMHKSGKFQALDHGERENIKIYGESKPPMYDLKKSDFPIAIFYGDNDACIQPQDIHKLSKELPNVTLLHRVDWAKCNHVDFLWGKDANKLVNSYVLDLFSKFS